MQCLVAVNVWLCQSQPIGRPGFLWPYLSTAVNWDMLEPVLVWDPKKDDLLLPSRWYFMALSKNKNGGDKCPVRAIGRESYHWKVVKGSLIWYIGACDVLRFILRIKCKRIGRARLLEWRDGGKDRSQVGKTLLEAKNYLVSFPLQSHQIQMTLNNTDLNCIGPLICKLIFFSINITAILSLDFLNFFFSLDYFIIII